MTKTKNVLGAAVASALLVMTGTVAVAKNPNSGGGGAGPSHTPGVPQGQASDNSGWTTPPGWSSDGKREGWESATPPGWTNNDGEKKGWSGDAASPPGIEKR